MTKLFLFCHHTHAVPVSTVMSEDNTRDVDNLTYALHVNKQSTVGFDIIYRQLWNKCVRLLSGVEKFVFHLLYIMA